MRRLVLIGIGAGHPDHVTAQAARAIDATDVVFVVTKEGTDELVALRHQVVARHRTTDAPLRTVELHDPERPWRTAPDYPAAVAGWREQRADLWEAALRDELGEDDTGAFLVWGDPSLYESTLTVVQEVRARGVVDFDLEVVPGVSSVHALTAAHQISLNRVGRAVQITPARLIAEHGGLPADVDDVVVMLDARTTFADIPADGLDIYWGAYLGTPDELLIAGPLAQVAPEIVRARADAKERKGWMFDTYLLRRTD